jgi:PIN domain nuclease of toxin-antitoxin system
MTRLLLDSNALVWLAETKPMQASALTAIRDAQAAGTLYVSPVTAWEIALAAHKKDPARRPDLGGLHTALWFQEARRRTGAKLALIGSRLRSKRRACRSFLAKAIRAIALSWQPHM